MSEIFDTVKDTFDTVAKSGKGGKSAALPWIIAGVGVAAVALFVGSKRSTSGSSTGTITGYSVPSGTPSPEVSAEDLDNLTESINKSLSGLTTGIGAEIDRIDKRFETLDTATAASLETLSKSTTAAINQQQSALTSTVSAFAESLRTVESKVEDRTITPAPAGTGTVSAAAPVQADRLSQQVQAYTQIKALGDAWAKETDPAVRAAIHGQAEAIGIAAGFGAGGPSGAARVIPSEVLAAAGTGAK